MLPPLVLPAVLVLLGLAAQTAGQTAPAANTWYTNVVQRAGPPPHLHTACVSFTQTLYVFGGLEATSTGIVNSSKLYQFDLATNDWTLIGDAASYAPKPWPVARWGHTATQIFIGQQVYTVVYGGANDRRLWLYGLETANWTTIEPDDDSPPALRFHSAAGAFRTVFIFGGCPYDNKHADFHCETPIRDLWMWREQDSWTKLTPLGPPARFGHQSMMLNSMLVIVGGWPSQAALSGSVSNTLDSTWLINVSAISSTTADLPNTSPIGEAWHRLPLQAISELHPEQIGYGIGLTLDNMHAMVTTGRPNNALATTSDAWVLEYTNSTPIAKWSLLQASLNPGIPNRDSACGVTMPQINAEPLVMVYGGVSTFTFFDDLWTVDPTTGYWWPNTQNTWPVTRILSGGVQLLDQIFMFGGMSTQRVNVLQDIWQLNPEDNSWTIVEAVLEPRFGFTVTPLNNSAAILFAGSTALGFAALLNDAIFITYDSQGNLEQQEMPTVGAVYPPGRLKHAAALVGQCLYIFGGQGQGQGSAISLINLSDLWRGCLVNNHYQAIDWSYLGDASTSSTWPSARSDLQAFVVGFPGYERMVVFAGATIDNDYFQDMWIYPPSQQAWFQLATSTPLGFRFLYAASVLSATRVIIYGGLSSIAASIPLSDVWVLTFDGTSMYSQPSYSLIEALVPLPRYGHFTILHQQTIYSFAGQSTLQASTAEQPSQMQTVPTLLLGCQAGETTRNILAQECTPCPVGSYGGGGTSICELCGPETTTPTIGSLRQADCSVCLPGVCNGNGDCSVDQTNFAVSCSCHMGFAGTKCQLNVAGIAAGSIIGLLIGIAVFVWLYRRQKMQAVAFKHDSELKHRLLEQSQQELEDLERTFNIQPSELRFIRHIAKGGFADVWLAEWREKPVAVKSLMKDLVVMDATATAEFDKEVKLLRKLRSQHIVLFYGTGVRQGLPFLVTDYMPKGSLRDVLDDQTLDIDVRRKRSFSIDAAQGLHFLHQLSPPMIHRDVKSLNYLVSDAWRVKITDFGTARLLGHFKKAEPMEMSREQSSSLSLTRGVGTVCWSAPEVLSFASYSLPSDVFSLCVVLWEIETRRVPFVEKRSRFHVQQAILAGERPEIDSSCSEELSGLLRWGWNSDPAQRPTALDVVKALSGSSQEQGDHDGDAGLMAENELMDSSSLFGSASYLSLESERSKHDSAL